MEKTGILKIILRVEYTEDKKIPNAGKIIYLYIYTYLNIIIYFKGNFEIFLEDHTVGNLIKKYLNYKLRIIKINK